MCVDEHAQQRLGIGLVQIFYTDMAHDEYEPAPMMASRPTDGTN